MKKKARDEANRFDEREDMDAEELDIPEDGEYDIGQDKQLKLMPFQVNCMCSVIDYSLCFFRR